MQQSAGPQSEIVIVLVEDDEGHARLIEKNLRRAGIGNRIIQLHDGAAAVDFLTGPERRTAGNVEPLLVLLDLNLPVRDGYQVLAAIKGNAATRRIPVVILSTTDNPAEVERCYELGCNAYITKPVEYDRFADAIGKLGMFLSIVKIPEVKERHG